MSGERKDKNVLDPNGQAEARIQGVNSKER